MAQYEGIIDGAWAIGEIVVRPGESIVFNGTVSGVTLETVELVFYADGEGTYRYAKGEMGDYGDQQTQALIVKHVEQALVDEGFDIDPKVASEDYEPYGR